MLSLVWVLLYTTGQNVRPPPGFGSNTILCVLVLVLKYFAQILKISVLSKYFSITSIVHWSSKVTCIFLPNINKLVMNQIVAPLGFSSIVITNNIIYICCIHRRRNPPGYPAMAGRPRGNPGYYPVFRVLPGKKLSAISMYW